MLDLSDEAIRIDIDEYLVLRLYAAVVAADEIIYKLLSESFKELFIKLQRENVFTQFKM